MTRTLQHAFDEASQASEDLQEVIAALVLAELEAEARWAKSFENSQDLLASMGRKALAEHRAGKTRPLKIDEL